MKKLVLFFYFVQPLFAQNTAKPWTFWWIMGNALDSTQSSLQLQKMAKSGLGGVHIIPIYGAKGHEKDFIPFMSKSYIEQVSHIVSVAKSLGMGVDMTLGTGWPTGGQKVDSLHAALKMKFENGEWTFKNTFQKVKRAAPGGEGWVLDHFDKASFEKYFNETGFKQLENVGIRALYSDSYEVFEANSTHGFFDKFRKINGYDIREYSAYFQPEKMTDTSLKILHDVRSTMSKLLFEQFQQPFSENIRQIGKLSRNQAHGSPGNLVDLYAALDIPETESFGSSRFQIPSLRVDPDYEVNVFGTPDVLAMKMASSAAHLTGKKLVSSETATWLGNHFKVSLDQVKPQIDQLFMGGVNHIFYHGTTYSPTYIPWPGWLFYASTNFGAMSHFAGHLPLLNKYVETCQNILQNSEPTSEVLLYFNIDDLWSQKPKNNVGDFPLQMLEVHHTNKWLTPSSMGIAAQKLTEMGVGFDFVSDAILENAILLDNKSLKIGKNTYKSLIIPASDCMPLATAERLKDWINEGVKIIFLDKKPTKTGGLKDAGQIKGLLANGQIYDRLDGIFEGEEMAKKGLDFIKKTINGQTVYFVVNLKGKAFDRNLKLNAKSKNWTVQDPLNGQSFGFENGSQISILPGQSFFIIEEYTKPQKWPKRDSIEINTEWSLDLAPKTPLKSLDYWTNLGVDSLQYYAGFGTYSAQFDLPKNKTKMAYLYIENIREAADVTINGQAVGTFWSLPHRLALPRGILKKHNSIEIKVRNLDANKMRKFDTEHKEWRNFYDINMADITYKPFDASKWKTEDSGLSGRIVLKNH